MNNSLNGNGVGYPQQSQQFQQPGMQQPVVGQPAPQPGQPVQPVQPVQPPVQPMAQSVARPVAQPVMPAAQPAQPAQLPMAQPAMPVVQPAKPLQPVVQPAQVVQPQQVQQAQTFGQQPLRAQQPQLQPGTQPNQMVSQPAQPTQPAQPAVQPVPGVQTAQAIQPVQPVQQPAAVAQPGQPAQPMQPTQQIQPAQSYPQPQGAGYQQYPYYSPQQPEKKKKTAIIVAIIIGVVVLGIFIAFGIYAVTNKIDVPSKPSSTQTFEKEFNVTESKYSTSTNYATWKFDKSGNFTSTKKTGSTEEKITGKYQIVSQGDEVKNRLKNSNSSSDADEVLDEATAIYEIQVYNLQKNGKAQTVSEKEIILLEYEPTKSNSSVSSNVTFTGVAFVFVEDQQNSGLLKREKSYLTFTN